MTFDARVFQFFVASPSDVEKERAIVREVLADWNDVNAQEHSTVLLPIMWESHSAPELGGRPQQMINDRLLINADALIGIFWTRIGTPTGKAISGTLEEIQEHHSRGRPTHLFFSSKPIAPANVDAAQYEEVERIKRWAVSQGIIGVFRSPAEFRKKLTHQLPLMLRSDHLREARHTPSQENRVPIVQSVGGLSPAASHYLRQAVATARKILILRQTPTSVEILCDRVRLFVGPPSAEAAINKAALGELASRGLVDISQGGRDETHFTVNKNGIGWTLRHPE